MVYAAWRLPSPISIHAPLARCDSRRELATLRNELFQSTHLLRGATPRGYADGCKEIFQSTHLLRGATRCGGLLRSSVPFQSTHLLRGATQVGCASPTPLLFQSTHLLRGATNRAEHYTSSSTISIHAPLARCDGKTIQKNSFFPQQNSFP